MSLLLALNWGNYIIYTWSLESIQEPVHVHVTNLSRRKKGDTKFWLMVDGTVQLGSKNTSVLNRDLNDIMEIIRLNFIRLAIEYNKLHPRNGGLKLKI